MAAIVGNFSGLASVALNRSLVMMSEWLHHFRHYWWVFVLPAVGAALSSLFLEKVVNEGAGHGVPEVMEAVTLRNGFIRKRIVVVKSLASAITIGTGGSVGREGPIVQIGSAIGSSIGQLLHISADRMRTLVGCGAAAGVAAEVIGDLLGSVVSVTTRTSAVARSNSITGAVSPESSPNM